MLCGVALAFTPDTAPGVAGTLQNIVQILGMAGLGADRKAIDNVSNDDAGSFGKRLFSCIAMLKPFQVRVAMDTNSSAWTTNIKAYMGQITITWPVEVGYSTGGTLAFKGAMTDFSFGAPDIEGRIEGSFTITPSGAPTIVAGTVAS